MGDTTAAEQAQGTCLVVGAAMVFALVALVVKVDPLPLLPATQCRFLISWLVSIAFMLVYKKERGLLWFGPPRLRWALVLKGTLSFTFITLWWGALRRAPMGNCIAIIYCSPVLTSLFSRALLKEALPREFAAQVLLVSCGVVLVLDPPFLHRGDAGVGTGGGATMLRDYGPVFLALLVCAMVPVATRVTRDCSWIEVEHVNACLATCVYGPSLLVAQYALSGAAPPLRAGADSAWQGMLIVLAALGSFVGIAMETKGYQLAEVGRATMFRYVEVPFAYLLQAAATGQAVAPRAVLGSTCILASCALGLACRPPRKAAEAGASEEPLLAGAENGKVPGAGADAAAAAPEGAVAA